MLTTDPGLLTRLGFDDNGYCVRCEVCGHNPGVTQCLSTCTVCSGSYTFDYPPILPVPLSSATRDPGIWRYRERLPIGRDTPLVSLGEGLTPLLRACSTRPFELYFKDETVNPTGSHKDRALSVGITRAVECGFDTCMLYSDGSAALSSAAYAARAGLRNIAVVPMDTPDSRLFPLAIYNSEIIEFAGTSDEALDWVHEASVALRIYESSTYRQADPYGAEGTKTISYEIVDQLGSVPDWLVVAVGGGGTLAAIWRGFLELRTLGLTYSLPKLVGVLPRGYRVLEIARKCGAQTERELRALADFSLPETAQVKIAMRYPPDGIDAIRAVRDSGGRFAWASDEAAWAAQSTIGAQEGIYVEVSSTGPLVAIDQLQAEGAIRRDEKVVAVLCGSGFRETGAARSSLVLRKHRLDRATGLTGLEAMLNSNASHR